MRPSLLALSTLLCSVTCQSTFSPLRPPAIPLAVRSPYMSTWQEAGSQGGNGGYLAGQWPTFWNGAITGWTGLIRVDGVVYTWLGKPNVTDLFVNQTAFSYTSTRSVFEMDVGGVVGMNVTFLSPVFPTDMLRASLPYSYMEVDVWSTDGQIHDVSLYTDISAEWVSGNRGSIAEWSYGVINSSEASAPSSVASPTHATMPTTVNSVYRLYGTNTIDTEKPTTVKHSQTYTRDGNHGFKPTSYGGPPSEYWSSKTYSKSSPTASPAPANSGVAYHKVWRQTQLAFSETADQTDYGYWYYATNNDEYLTHQSGADVDVRGQFVNAGFLLGTEDTNYRAINDSFPTFAFAVDFGSVEARPESRLFQLSLHQENAVQFLGDNGNQTVPSLWTSYFGNELDAVSFFYNDFATSSDLATKLDNQIASDSIANGGQNYADMTTLATRQAFGSIEWTNTPSEPWIFMKEISSDGNVNTVDVIFPFHPIAIYLNPDILKYLLDPLFINQEAGNWPYAYSIHDIGSAFPNATGHQDGMDEQQPLEECGDMLIMTLAYAQRANDNAYLTQHYDILRQWTGYLVYDSLIPANQISTDDFAGSLANQTNLAIKGIIGIEAFAQIANRTGHDVDGVNYTQIAHSYLEQWQVLGIAQDANPPHTTLAYGQNDTYSLLYNIFADKELGLGFIPQSVYDMQSAFYPTQFNTYGVPLDTRHTYTKLDWQIFCASVASASTKDEFLSVLAHWTDVTPTNFPWTDLYDTVNASYPGNGPTFIARPVIGGVFAPLALESAPQDGYVAPWHPGH